MIIQTKDFIAWLDDLTIKEKAHVFARLERIEFFNHFGDVKHIGDGLCELRWKNGWRVYFIKDIEKNIILLIGGTKNDQKKNINKARLLVERYTNYEN